MSFFDVPGFVVDAAVGNDKVIAVPTNETWKLLGVYVEFTTTATVGTRQLRLQIRDASAGLLVVVEWGETQILSLVRNYAAAPEVEGFTDLAAEMVYAGIPNTRMIPGFDVRVFDDADIDVLDTISVALNRTKDTEQ